MWNVGIEAVPDTRNEALKRREQMLGRNARKALGNKGFTLQELLQVVLISMALAVVVGSCIFVVAQNMRMRELNSAAEQVAIAAQSRMTSQKASGVWLDGLLVENQDDFDGAQSSPAYTANQESEWGAALSFPDATRYFTKEQALELGIVGRDSLDPAVLEGDFVIEFDPATASVVSVFYSDGRKGPFDRRDAAALAEGTAHSYYLQAKESSNIRQKLVRWSNKPMVGYYWGTPKGATSDYAIVSPVIKVSKAGELCVRNANLTLLPQVSTTVSLKVVNQDLQKQADGAYAPKDDSQGSRAIYKTNAFKVSGLDKGLTTVVVSMEVDGVTREWTVPNVANVLELTTKTQTSLDKNVFALDLNALQQYLWSEAGYVYDAETQQYVEPAGGLPAGVDEDLKVIAREINQFRPAQKDASGTEVLVPATNAKVHATVSASEGSKATADARIEWPTQRPLLRLYVTDPSNYASYQRAYTASQAGETGGSCRVKSAYVRSRSQLLAHASDGLADQTTFAADGLYTFPQVSVSSARGSSLEPYAKNISEVWQFSGVGTNDTAFVAMLKAGSPLAISQNYLGQGVFLRESAAKGATVAVKPGSYTTTASLEKTAYEAGTTHEYQVYELWAKVNDQALRLGHTEGTEWKWDTHPSGTSWQDALGGSAQYLDAETNNYQTLADGVELSAGEAIRFDVRQVQEALSGATSQPDYRGGCNIYVRTTPALSETATWWSAELTQSGSFLRQLCAASRCSSRGDSLANLNIQPAFENEFGAGSSIMAAYFSEDAGQRDDYNIGQLGTFPYDSGTVSRLVYSPAPATAWNANYSAAGFESSRETMEIPSAYEITVAGSIQGDAGTQNKLLDASWIGANEDPLRLVPARMASVQAGGLSGGDYEIPFYEADYALGEASAPRFEGRFYQVISYADDQGKTVSEDCAQTNECSAVAIARNRYLFDGSQDAANFASEQAVVPDSSQHGGAQEGYWFVTMPEGEVFRYVDENGDVQMLRIPQGANLSDFIHARGSYAYVASAYVADEEDVNADGRDYLLIEDLDSIVLRSGISEAAGEYLGLIYVDGQDSLGSASTAPTGTWYGSLTSTAESDVTSGSFASASGLVSGGYYLTISEDSGMDTAGLKLQQSVSLIGLEAASDGEVAPVDTDAAFDVDTKQVQRAVIGGKTYYLLKLDWKDAAKRSGRCYSLAFLAEQGGQSLFTPTTFYLQPNFAQAISFSESAARKWGSEASPWRVQISSQFPGSLATRAARLKFRDEAFVQLADINMDVMVGQHGFEGFGSDGFCGTYDGKNHYIGMSSASCLSFDQAQGSFGLFPTLQGCYTTSSGAAATAATGTLHNPVVKNVKAYVGSSFNLEKFEAPAVTACIGLLVGFAADGATIQNVGTSLHSSTVKVGLGNGRGQTADNAAFGLVIGEIEGSATVSQVKLGLTGASEVALNYKLKVASAGGMVGLISQADVAIDSLAMVGTGSLQLDASNATTSLGGLVGAIDEATVTLTDASVSKISLVHGGADAASAAAGVGALRNANLALGTFAFSGAFSASGLNVTGQRSVGIVVGSMQGDSALIAAGDAPAEVSLAGSATDQSSAATSFAGLVGACIVDAPATGQAVRDINLTVGKGFVADLSDGNAEVFSFGIGRILSADSAQFDLANVNLSFEGSAEVNLGDASSATNGLGLLVSFADLAFGDDEAEAGGIFNVSSCSVTGTGSTSDVVTVTGLNYGFAENDQNSIGVMLGSARAAKVDACSVSNIRMLVSVPTSVQTSDTTLGIGTIAGSLDAAGRGEDATLTNASAYRAYVGVAASEVRLTEDDQMRLGGLVGASTRPELCGDPSNSARNVYFSLDFNRRILSTDHPYAKTFGGIVGSAVSDAPANGPSYSNVYAIWQLLLYRTAWLPGKWYGSSISQALVPSTASPLSSEGNALAPDEVSEESEQELGELLQLAVESGEIEAPCEPERADEV